MSLLRKKTIALSLIALTALFNGCNEGNTSSVDTSIAGQLVDSYIQGAHYKCSDGQEGTTNENGDFTCDTLPVTFTVNGIKLGEITSLPEDKNIFPQDLVGVERSDVNNSEVLAMAQLLQSLDSDQDPENGISIDTNLTTNISEDFNASNLDTYLSNAEVSKVTQENAYAHLEKTTHTVETIDGLSDNIPSSVLEDDINTPLSTLTDDIKEHIAYMGNEERLAYDVYNALSVLYPDQQVLINIPQKSEIQHLTTVKALVAKYSLDSEVLSVRDVNNSTLSSDSNISSVAGIYDIQVIQDLYDTLISKGESSEVDALQVGCMVEVTDINDLDISILAAEESNATDVVGAFNFLRDGSYSHYWSFDNSLKNAGVTDGCCSLGDEYCKTEADYPVTDKGNDEKKGDGSGEQKRKGKQ